MKCIRTLLAAVAAAPAALLLGLLGTGTAAAETIHCPNVNTAVVDNNCKATANVTGNGANTGVDSETKADFDVIDGGAEIIAAQNANVTA